MFSRRITPFAHATTTPIKNDAKTKHTVRLVSTPCDEDDIPPRPITSFPNEESITGALSDIEYKYHVDSRILGTGHHGSVRACTDRTTGQRYAVKSICKSDPAMRAGGLAREISLLEEMKHDSIIQLVDVFEDAEFVHLVTDLCAGGELYDKIVDNTSADNGTPCLAEHKAARIICQVLKAVSYLHQKGIVHRDIKPENILFETNEEDSPIKIIDFGLSRKHRGRRGEPPMTTLVGTPYYIAPETLRKKYDKSCDLWSVGVIAYVILCGYPPFNGTSHDETHKSVLRGQYYFPAEDWKNISDEAIDFIYRALQMNPKKRMTADQALKHPWILKHTGKEVVALVEDECQVEPPVEVLYNEPWRKRSVVVWGGSPPRQKRKVRTSMFGL